MKRASAFAAFLIVFATQPAFAWHDQTHLAIAKAAGYEKWYNAAGADMAKIKAEAVEAPNHWFNNSAGVEITAKTVLQQVDRYNDPKDAEGHLYGAILASFQAYRAVKQQGKYADYHIAFCAHYLGDLSMPFHNTPRGEDRFNSPERHARNDGIIEYSALSNVGLIQKDMDDIRIASDDELAREIARVANESRRLAFRLEKEKRDMTRDEAYVQAARSASLLRAVLIYAGIAR